MPLSPPPRNWGRMFGSPVSLRKIPSPCPSGLHAPSQRQYWMGTG